MLNRFRAYKLNSGEQPDFTFWRDKNGLEIDILENLVSKDGHPFMNAWEIKSGTTPSLSYFDNLSKWSALAGDQLQGKGVIYAGGESRRTGKGGLTAYRKLDLGSIREEEC